ncbi:ribosomal l35Ae domain-containing protein [Rhizoctonia solani AG-1 IA]|uniref:Ribosomal l35Ae domain-containing protein n=1 Tax=Thanatephorus cucumeris (strain AG1-IA) TaxID=983506 RepID=L8X209_THACA|nr:ribosomal l35Ae domain-containing protein [Rhizoctonia solani AG-1 IA]
MPSTRLYTKGRILGHKRGKRNTRPNTSLIQIEGVSNKDEAQFYLGKRLAYVYKANRVTRPHGNSGVVKSKFRSNIPPHAFGASVRVVCSTPPRFDSTLNAIPARISRAFGRCASFGITRVYIHVDEDACCDLLARSGRLLLSVDDRVRNRGTRRLTHDNKPPAYESSDPVMLSDTLSHRGCTDRVEYGSEFSSCISSAV